MDLRESGTQIRLPATANLLLDSSDRDQQLFPSAASFSITKNQAILNGFFNRIATTELCMEWRYPNINPDLSNNFINFQVGATSYTADIPTGSYTMEQMLDKLVLAMNALASGVTFSIVQVVAGTGGGDTFIAGTGAYDILEGGIANQLFQNSVIYPVASAGAANLSPSLQYADIRPFRYIDFVSQELTYNQELQDATTNEIERNVLLRWYMAWEQEPSYDGYGFPILMGYKDFVYTKQYNPPKQIRWNPRQPVGNLRFALFVALVNEDATIPFPQGVYDANLDWLLTLQVSEN